MNAVTYNEARPPHGSRLIPTSSILIAGSPLWETKDFLQILPVDSSKPEVDPRGEARTFYKPEETPASKAAKASYFGRVYLDWAVFPLRWRRKRLGRRTLRVIW